MGSRSRVTRRQPLRAVVQQSADEEDAAPEIPPRVSMTSKWLIVCGVFLVSLFLIVASKTVSFSPPVTSSLVETSSSHRAPVTETTTTAPSTPSVRSLGTSPSAGTSSKAFVDKVHDSGFKRVLLTGMLSPGIALQMTHGYKMHHALQHPFEGVEGTTRITFDDIVSFVDSGESQRPDKMRNWLDMFWRYAAPVKSYLVKNYPAQYGGGEGATLYFQDFALHARTASEVKPTGGHFFHADNRRWEPVNQSWELWRENHRLPKERGSALSNVETEAANDYTISAIFFLNAHSDERQNDAYGGGLFGFTSPPNSTNGFKCGTFELKEEERHDCIEELFLPDVGSLVLFTSGPENMHFVTPLSGGRRYTWNLWLTLNPARSIEDRWKAAIGYDVYT